MPKIDLRYFIPPLILIVAAGTACAATLDVTDSGLKLWLRADNVTTSGSTVQTWHDLSTGAVGDGVAQDAALSNGGPTVVSGDLNGRDTVNFGGGGAYTYSGSLGISGSQEPFTGFAVVRQLNFDSNQRVLQFGAITPHNGGESVAIDADAPGFRFNNGNLIFNESFSTTVYRAGMWRMTNTDTYGSGELRINGAVATQSSSANPTYITNVIDQGYTLGKGIATGGGNNDWLNARVGEVLLYDRVLSEADVDRVHFYLRHRYSLDFNAVIIPGTNMATMSSNISTAPALASIDTDVHESDVDAVFFIEKQGFALSSAVDVNIAAGPGTYTSGFDTVDDTLAAGTNINSYYLSFDTADNSGTAYAPTFTIEFDEQILGIITSNSGLAGTEGQLGSAGTTYNTTNLGLENSATDQIVIGADGRTLSATLRVAGSNLDQIRIITIPEPATMGLLALGFAGLLIRKRRRIHAG